MIMFDSNATLLGSVVKNTILYIIMSRNNHVSALQVTINFNFFTCMRTREKPFAYAETNQVE